jgi:hypothetical protein
VLCYRTICIRGWLRTSSIQQKQNNIIIIIAVVEEAVTGVVVDGWE